MKKNLFLTILAVSFSIISFGQLKVFVPVQSSVSPTNVSIANGDTILVTGDTVNEMNVNLYLINPGPISSLTVNARRDSLNTPVAFDNCFCWGGLCFSNSTTVAPPGYTETISKGDTTFSPNDFQGHYFPYGHTGVAYIRYDFYTEPVSGDSAWVVVEYNATPTGIKTISAADISFSAPYPNPANNIVNFNYSLAYSIQSANLEIFNMLGECVQTLPLNTLKNNAIVNVQSMPSGIYICVVEANGSQSAYRKLIVSH